MDLTIWLAGDDLDDREDGLDGPGGSRTPVRDFFLLKLYVRSPGFVLGQLIRAACAWVTDARGNPIESWNRWVISSSKPYPGRVHISWLRRETERRLSGLATEQRNDIVILVYAFHAV